MQLPELVGRDPIVVRETTFTRISVNGKEKIVPLGYYFGTHYKEVSPMDDAFIMAFLIVNTYLDFPNVKSVCIAGVHSLGGGFTMDMDKKVAVILGELPSEVAYSLEEFIDSFKYTMEFIGFRCEVHPSDPTWPAPNFLFLVSNPDKCLRKDISPFIGLGIGGEGSLSFYIAQ